MSDEGIHVRRSMPWGALGLIILVGVSIGIFLFLGPRSSGALYHPFFPLGFGWLGGVFFGIHNFRGIKVGVLAVERRILFLLAER